MARKRSWSSGFADIAQRLSKASETLQRSEVPSGNDYVLPTPGETLPKPAKVLYGGPRPLYKDAEYRAARIVLRESRVPEAKLDQSAHHLATMFATNDMTYNSRSGHHRALRQLIGEREYREALRKEREMYEPM